jgi:hypothetical protein
LGHVVSIDSLGVSLSTRITMAHGKEPNVSATSEKSDGRRPNAVVKLADALKENPGLSTPSGSVDLYNFLAMALAMFGMLTKVTNVC